MATAKDFRAIALSLEGTTEAPHFDRAAFKVKRIYATLASDGQSANLMFTPDEQEFKCILAPEAFAPVPNAWGKRGATTVTLAAIKTSELRDALAMAWRHALPSSRGRSARGPAAKLGRDKSRGDGRLARPGRSSRRA
jgi:hypothetical protein